ncbi:FecR family protein [Draconibacterium sp. IB214405]|uniref:FecR family protein n=1 Tax=Draconibacterium sp. IB214405 TaxID=3097352 RepID=UPI002A0BA83D|nr:FecR family protein [Draconibacterium sp. IB214405]MDX8339625.1 FecR family protein [Draconibacterium sp. IB214405]
MNKEILYNFALNKLTKDSEIEEVIKWIESSEENKKEFETIKNLWAISGFENYESYVKKKTNRTVFSRPKRIIPSSLFRYAAIFILAFTIGSISVYFLGSYNKDELTWNEIIVPEGESAEVYLSDNTHVWLNSNSKLTYPSQFQGKEREVKLKGEAYFGVTHNPENPFYVHTDELSVAVTGTSFNVQSYKQDDHVNVTLVEGKVELHSPEGKCISELSPGENAQLNITRNTLSIRQVDTEYYTSWKAGFLVFKNERLEDIVQKFERWYNIQVIFEDEEIRQIEYTGTILKNKPIDQIFNILKFTAEIDYSIKRIDNKPSIIYLKKKPM